MDDLIGVSDRTINLIKNIILVSEFICK